MADKTEKQDWYEPGLSFECTQCGNCCTGPTGFVWFTEAEGQAIADYLRLSYEDFLHRYGMKKFGRLSLGEVKRKGQYDCVFLTWNEDRTRAGCSIYPVRPTQCRTWPFWPSNLKSRRHWDRAAKRCPGMQKGGVFIPADEVRVIRDRNEPDL